MDKKFRITSNKLGCASAAFVLSFFLLSYLWMKIFNDFEEHVFKYLAISSAVGIVLAIICVIFAKEHYIEILNDGFEITRGNKVTKYAFTDFVGSNVTKNYTNGIYTGTTRELKIKGKDGKVFNISASKLSEKQFSELVNYLSRSEFKETHDIEVVEGYFDEEKRFSIPRESIIKANKKPVVLWGASFIAATVLCIVLFVVYFLINKSLIFFIPAVVAGGYVLVFGVGEFIPLLKKSRKVMSIPEVVTVDSLGITVDSERYNLDNITNISMVPASYKDILTRDLIFKTKDGNTHKYNFGSAKNTMTTYEEYDKLYTTIRMLCIAKNISFMSILG